MRRRGWIPFLLFAVTLVCFWRLFHAEYSLLDDIFTVQNNPNFLPPTLKGVLSYWPPFRDGHVNEQYGLYIPLTYTFWGTIATVAQTKSIAPGSLSPIELNPYLFHIANIIVHATSGLLVFAILRRLLDSDWPACIGALVFVIHPVQVEAVAWISGTKDLLAGMFTLLALLELLRFRAASKSTLQRAHYALMLLATAAAMLSKPSAVILPAIPLVVDVVLLRRPFRDSLIAQAPALLLAALCAYIATRAQPAADVSPARLWARPLVVADALAFYLWKLIVPLRLGVDYGRRPQAVMSHWWFYLTWLAPTIVALVIWRIRRSQPSLLAGALIFVIAAAPTLGLTTFLFQRFSTTADHYLYLPMLGVAMCVASLMRKTRDRIAAGVVLVIWAALTILQTSVWQNDRLLFLHALTVNPKSFMAQSNLSADALREGDIEEAEYRLEQAKQSEPFMKLVWDIGHSQLQKAKNTQSR